MKALRFRSRVVPCGILRLLRLRITPHVRKSTPSQTGCPVSRLSAAAVSIRRQVVTVAALAAHEPAWFKSPAGPATSNRRTGSRPLARRLPPSHRVEKGKKEPAQSVRSGRVLAVGNGRHEWRTPFPTITTIMPQGLAGARAKFRTDAVPQPGWRFFSSCASSAPARSRRLNRLPSPRNTRIVPAC